MCVSIESIQYSCSDISILPFTLGERTNKFQSEHSNLIMYTHYVFIAKNDGAVTPTG